MTELGWSLLGKVVGGRVSVSVQTVLGALVGGQSDNGDGVFYM